MKKLVFGLIATVMFGFVGNAQSNNPQNQFGIDVVNVSQIIAKDYIDGKIKVVTQATIDTYFSKYSANYPIASLDQYNKISDAFSKSTNETAIANSGLSAQGKDFLKRSLIVSTTKLVDEVKISNLVTQEKETILKYLAVNYNLVKPVSATNPTSVGGKGPSANFDFVNYEDNTLLVQSESVGSFGAWGGFGSIVGFAIGGPVGMFIGGAIGVVTHIIILHNGGSSSNSGGGGNPPPKP